MRKMSAKEQISANGGTANQKQFHDALVWYGNRVSEIPYVYGVTYLWGRSHF